MLQRIVSFLVTVSALIALILALITAPMLIAQGIQAWQVLLSSETIKAAYEALLDL